MTTLAAAKPRTYVQGDIMEYPVIASEIIYEGAAVSLVAASGHANPAQTDEPFVGFALQTCDNSAGAAAAKNVLVRTRGTIVLPVTSIAITDIGDMVYLTDDDTFDITSTTATAIGHSVRFISTGNAEVYFDTTLSMYHILAITYAN